MTRCHPAALLLAASLLLPVTTVHASEEDAVRKPLEAYLRGHVTGDGRHMREAFWPEEPAPGAHRSQLAVPADAAVA